MKLVITRPFEDSLESQKKIQAVSDISCFIQPVMEVIMLEKKIELPKDAVIVITSMNGIRALASNSDVRSFRIITVGEQSAKEARRLGFVRVESAAGPAVSASEMNLIKYIKANLDNKIMINHISAGITKGGLKKKLQEDGYKYNRIILYISEPVKFTEEFIEKVRLGQFDAYSFFSPRSAALFAKEIYENGLGAFLHRSVAFCFSENVILGLSGLNFAKIYIPEVTNSENFVNLICTHNNEAI